MSELGNCGICEQRRHKRRSRASLTTDSKKPKTDEAICTAPAPNTHELGAVQNAIQGGVSNHSRHNNQTMPPNPTHTDATNARETSCSTNTPRCTRPNARKHVMPRHTR